MNTQMNAPAAPLEPPSSPELEEDTLSADFSADVAPSPALPSPLPSPAPLSAPLLSSLWRPLQLFNGYRLALSLALALFPLYYMPSQTLLPGHYRTIALGVGMAFIILVCASLLLSFLWKRHFLIQLSFQVLFDAICIGTLTFLYEGVQSGLGLVLLLSIAGASLVTQGKLALFYASIFSIAILSAESLHFLLRRTGDVNFLTAGLLCTSFFTIAISVNWLGRRLMKNEALAYQRNIERNNQIQINMQVMEYMQDGVIVVDNSGRVLNLNLKAREILRTRGSLQLDKVFPELAEAYRKWKRTKSKASIILKKSNGDDSAQGYAQEVSARFMATRTSDETALIFIEDMEHVRNEALQLKLASLGRLTANIAHEIRNPLAAISHATELLQEEAKDFIQNRLIRIIHDNTLRLDQIIQEILILGRRGNREVERNKIMLPSYLNEFVHSFSVQAGIEDGILCATAPEEAVIYFNPLQLQQVLWNIVSNALRYSTRQQGAVRIEARLDDTSVELHILDDGPGVQQGLHEQVFEPFFTTSARGTGLGLHIARELCEANQARLILGLEGGGHFIVTQLMEETTETT